MAAVSASLCELLVLSPGPLKSSVALLVAPALAELQAVVAAIGTAAIAGRKCPPCHEARGRAWVLVGLLRWRLLLPEHPVDPGEPHAIHTPSLPS